MTLYLNETMPKKEKIRNLFDSIAPDYDRLNHILSFDIDRSWREKAVKEAVCPDQDLKILDIACGTGDFSIGIARKASPKSIVIGLDLSEKMLEIGRAKVHEEGLDEKIALVQGDCEALPYPERSFDRVTAAFGVRNFENLKKGLSEMCRILRPGGKAVILELSVPDNRFILWMYKLYFTRMLPEVGGLVSGNKEAYRYLPASVIAFPKPDKFKKILEECGFTGVSCRSFSLGICRMYVARKG